MKALKDPLEWHRLSHRLHSGGWHRMSRSIDYFVRWWFGCFVPGSAAIGAEVKFGYGGLGIVIHKDARIGARTVIAPGVLLGGNGVDIGAPIIGEDVLVGAGAKVLGPVTIGNGSRIGANAVVITDVPEGSVAVGVPARIRAKTSG